MGRMNGAGAGRPDPEVPERARRRTFTAKYKLEMLAAYDAADGDKGALLRRESLYSSHIVAWRRARDAGALAGPAVPRGRERPRPQAKLIARVERHQSRRNGNWSRSWQDPLRGGRAGKTAEPENGSTKRSLCNSVRITSPKSDTDVC